MKIHHVCVVVSDMEESLKLYKDVLGFNVMLDRIIPDGSEHGCFFEQQTLDDIFQIKGAKSRMVLIRSEEGSIIELEQPIVPKIQKVAKEYLRYGFVGISEIAFGVTNIDEWFEKIKTAGYETQTNYIWEYGGIGRSFLFFDPDGNMLQMNEE